MGGVWRHLLVRLQRFARGEDAAAAVEFALVLPIMLMLYIGSVETTALISMDRKVQSVAGALGDLVARQDKTIEADMLSDYFLAAGGIMTPFPTDELYQVVTQVYVSATGVATVKWSKQYHAGTMSTKYATNATFKLPTAMTNIAKDSYVIVAEGIYDYPPLYGFAFKQTIKLYRQNFFVPRFGNEIRYVE